MFRLKQLLKMFLQNILLPFVYRRYAGRPVRKGSILFADAHHEEMPFSMRRVYELLEAQVTGGSEARADDFGAANGSAVCDLGAAGGSEARADDFGVAGRSAMRADDFGVEDGSAACADDFGAANGNAGTGGVSDGGLRIQVFVRDFGRMSYVELLRYLFRFMKEYATAEYVFICDYYLPAVACKKRPETTVVQLWHSCGLMKKIAYDTSDDIPKGYRGNMFGNYTYLTLSAEVCVPVHERALRLRAGRIRATGVSRTDYYFDDAWNARCRERFYREYPEARGKKIALWAPTFRGNAAHPILRGLDVVRETAQELLAEGWFFLIKAHPHVDAHGQVSNCTIPTEELLCVADVLITDYSSILFDYLIYEKPVILFAPDLEEYESGRGFYIDYRSMPFPIVQTGEALRGAVTGCREAYETYREALGYWKETYTGACDGHASERILEMVGLMESNSL